jgi:hypothetical protein
MALAENARAPVAKVLVYRDPCLQDINEIYREDEIIQGLNRIRISQDHTKRVILLTNIPLSGVPISKLVSLEELCGAVTAKKLVGNLIRLSLEKLGFTDFCDIDSLLSSDPMRGKVIAKRDAQWLKTKFKIDFPVTQEDKFSTRTLRTHFHEMVKELCLKKMKLISESKTSERKYLNIYAYNIRNVEVTLRSAGTWIDGRFRVEEYPKA